MDSIIVFYIPNSTYAIHAGSFENYLSLMNEVIKKFHDVVGVAEERTGKFFDPTDTSQDYLREWKEILGFSPDLLFEVYTLSPYDEEDFEMLELKPDHLENFFNFCEMAFPDFSKSGHPNDRGWETFDKEKYSNLMEWLNEFYEFFLATMMSLRILTE